MNKFPTTLVFRQYDANGRPLVNGYIVEREAYSQEDMDSYIKELSRLDYELEFAFSHKEFPHD